MGKNQVSCNLDIGCSCCVHDARVMVSFIFHIFRNLAIGEDNKSFIELNTKSLTPEQMRVIERQCNSDILAGTAVNVCWLQPEDPELAEVSEMQTTLLQVGEDWVVLTNCNVCQLTHNL